MNDDLDMNELFERVVCGVDDSEAGAVAARLASRVTDSEGTLTLVSVDDSSIAVHAGFQAAGVAAELLHEAEAALRRGSAAAEPDHDVATRLFEGNPLDCLLAELERERATLIAVGSHGHSRAVGIALGSVATHILHEARCSVLLARPVGDAGRWPRSILVGVDGSPESAAAAAVARRLAERFGAELRFVTASGDRPDLEAAREIAPNLAELPGHAVHELHVLSEAADLVVLGSRGLKGIRALGSVSERVAHEALCPVLVVRGRPHEEGR